MVVYTLWERKTRVRFPAPRPTKDYLLENQNIKAGCSIKVVFTHGVGKTRVRFPAARPDKICQTSEKGRPSSIFQKSTPKLFLKKVRILFIIKIYTHKISMYMLRYLN
jgi:hypothetical protein